MTGATAYCTLLGIGLGAYFGLNWSILLLGTAVLATMSIVEQQQYRPRLAALGRADFLQTTAMASVGNALLASAAAYAVGFGVRLVFGN